MIVATRVWRVCFIAFCFLFLTDRLTHTMVWDNRYFPWFDQLYTGSDSRHGFFDINAFFIVNRDAYRFEHRAIEKEQIVSVPELWGQLRLADVANAMTMVGLQNPIPQDWQWLSNFDALMPSSMDGQGIFISGYAPIGKHFGIGGNTFVLKLNSFVSILPGADAISSLNLNTPGNQALFTSMINQMFQELGIVSASYQEVGVGDVVVYGCVHDTHEYKYKFRKLDWGAYVGMIIPTATKQNWNNIASVPFGGGDGMWGWFVAPFAEFELKEDWIFGFQLRLTQRMDKTVQARIPINKEQVLFAPVLGDVSVDSGITISFAPYVAFSDLQAGFGVQAKYTITVHERDVFAANLSNMDVVAKLKNVNFYSGWTQEYATIKLFYDVAHDKNWKTRPLCYFAWDIPMNYIAGRGFAKTNRVSLGCNVNF